MNLFSQFQKKLLGRINRAIVPREILSLLFYIYLEALKRVGLVGPNLSRPIYNLPAELWIEILLLELNHTEWSPKDLQRLASVCKYWRNIILGNPRFWRVIDGCHSLKSCSLVLRRNLAGPLDVRLRGHAVPAYKPDIILSLIQLIAPKSRRIRSLYFTALPNDPYFRRFFDTVSLPSARNLTASVYPGTSMSIHTSFSVHINLGDGVPFRHLRLESVAIPWDTPRLSGLETLSLSNLSQTTPTLAQLHHILSSSPSLRRLSLRNWGRRSASGYPSNQEATLIRLPVLTNVEVRGLPESIHSHLLSMLDLPSLREVIWIGPSGPTSGSTLLHRSAQCIKASPGLLLDWDKRSRTLDIKSNYERRSNIFTPDDASLVILSIRNLENLSGLMKQVATLLHESSSVRFETNSKRAAKRARRYFKRSRGVVWVR